MSIQPRIAFVDGSASLGGAELSLSELVLPWRGNSTVFLFEDGPFRALLEARGVHVEIVPLGRAAMSDSKESGIPGPGTLLEVARHALRLSRRFSDYDLVHCNNQKGWVVGSIAAAIARRPSTYHLRDQLDRKHFSAIKIAVAIRTANLLARRVICNSASTRAAFEAAGGRRGLGTVLYNPIDQTAFHDAAPVAGLRDGFGSGDEPVYGIFSRLAHWKGQHVALEALAKLERGHLALVGSPFFGEEPYERSLRETAARLGIAHRVHFLGFRSDVPALLATFDGLLHTSIAPEPFGRVVLEGLLSGTPVAATDAGGVPEMIDHGRTGWLWPMGSHDALAEILRAWQDDPDATRRVALAGRESASRKFAPGALHDGFRQIVLDCARPLRS